MPRAPSPSSTRRHRLREAAVRVLYAIDIGGGDAGTAVERYTDTVADGPVQPDLAEWVEGVSGRIEEIDARIREASSHWKIERMAALDRSVIRLGTWELLARPEIPARVTINEAVDIARRYGGDESPAFVNGILDRVARLIESRVAEVDP